jgi:S1-C subfamily serine protease
LRTSDSLTYGSTVLFVLRFFVSRKGAKALRKEGVKANCLVFVAVLGASLVIVQPQLVRALTPVEVGAIAQKVTVRIGNDSLWGSGVIFARKGDRYYVLTGKYVVTGDKDKYVYTPDGSKHKLIDLRELKNSGLSVISFASNRSYQLAKITKLKSIPIGTDVYVSGFGVTNNNESIYILSQGLVVAISKTDPDGYTVVYNSNTRPGMGGGAVLNSDGELIAIHGKADTIINENQVVTRSGLSLGIPTPLFISEARRAIASSYTQLSPERSVVNSNSPPSQNEILSAPEISQIGKSIVVRIESDRTQGSGVIIQADGDKYTVLTAFHVVANPSKYKITTPDGQQHNLDSRNISKISDVDLANLQFQSAKKYQTAQMGDSDLSSEGSTIYVAGFSARTSTVRSIYRSVDGKVSAIDRESPAEGYGLIYTNDTLEGMSGGAVLNEKGQLVGIHGRAETKAQSSFLGSEQIAIAIGTGFNLGIPINTFKKTGSAIASNSQILSSQTKRPISLNRNRNIDNVNSTQSPLKASNKFFCEVKQNIPGVYARTSKGAVQFIKLTKDRNLAKCNSIAKRFQESYKNGRLQFLKSARLGNKSVICSVESINNSCTETTVLFDIPPNIEPNQILRKLLKVRLNNGSIIEL